MQHDIKSLKKLVSFCHKNGITKYKAGTFEIELAKISVKPKKDPTTSTGDSQGVPEFPSWDSLSPEQQMFWSSTPGNIPNA